MAKREIIFRLRVFAAWFPWFPVLILRELKPVARGVGKLSVRWSAWIYQEKREKAIEAAEKNEHSKAHERLVRSRSARAGGSVIVAAILAGGTAWMCLTQPWWVHAGVALAVLAVFDAVGRSGRPPTERVPVALPRVLNDSVPLSQITKSILATFEREGFPEGSVKVAEQLCYDVVRQEYRIGVSTEDAIRAEHLRAIERAVGAKDYAIRNLATDSASIRRLIIRIGDPLATTELPPFLPSNSRSITDYLDMGVSAGDTPYALKLAGIHTSVVGKTGSGKTEGTLWTMIDRLSACRDAIIYGIDLQAGPAFPMWREVIQKTAYDEEEAESLLLNVLEEVDRRMRVLQDAALSDDDEHDSSKWNAKMGPAIVIFIDEFAVFSVWDGSKKYPINLMALVERIIRTGRKVWVTLVMATQKTGNADFGSTVISSQTGIKILMACEEADTVRMLSVEQRDAGWSPHMFSPATDEEANDAGKAFVSSPRHRTPDIYRSYNAMSPMEVKRRARQRIADGLPSLHGSRTPVEVDTPPWVPQILEEVLAAFEVCGSPEWLTTATLLDKMNSDLNELKLAAQLKPHGVAPAKLPRYIDNAQPRGYELAAIQEAINLSQNPSQ